MCVLQIYNGFCTHPECLFIHKEEVFSAIQEQNGFCMKAARGLECDNGPKLCWRTHDPEARARLQLKNGVCELEVKYECV